MTMPMTMLAVMESRMGIEEMPGKQHNQLILDMWKDAGHAEIVDDETAWCSGAMCSAAKAAGLPFPPVNVNAMARSWLTWGKQVEPVEVAPGDVVIWPRGNSSWQGHVNCAKEVRRKGKKTEVRCIGGNQSHKSGGAITLTDWQDIKGAIGVRRAVPATVPDLRAAGSSEIKKADQLQNGGTAVTLIPVAIATVQNMLGPVEVPSFKTLPESLSWWQTLLGGANAVWNLVAAHPWLAGTAFLGILAVLVGRQLKAARLAKHQAGVPISAEVAKLAAA
jgi:uncharacterized protein (TIGR02594 family)